MSDIIVSEPLASQIRQEAALQGVDVEKLLEAALKRHRFYVQREKIDGEAAWWQNQPDEFRSPYHGQFVAVHNHEVVDHDEDEASLRKRVRAKYGRTPVLLIPAEGQRQYRITSTRLTR